MWIWASRVGHAAVCHIFNDAALIILPPMAVSGPFQMLFQMVRNTDPVCDNMCVERCTNLSGCAPIGAGNVVYCGERGVEGHPNRSAARSVR